MSQHLRPALSLTVLFTLILGLAYPLAMVGMGQLAFPYQSNGSLQRKGDVIIGSNLIGQNFSSEAYFWPRPSATAEAPYNGGASSGTNLGTTSAKLKAMVEAEVGKLRATGINLPVPADAVTSSGSGLDPHISEEYARLQIARIAKARGQQEQVIAALLTQQIEARTWGVFGEARVNVLQLNLALDAQKPS